MLNIFHVVAHLGVTYTSANKIANAINNGASIASAISLVSGIGSLGSLFFWGIKRVAYTEGKAALIAF